MIFPKEIINNSEISFRFKNKVKSKIIYLFLITLTLGIFSALPLIKTDVYFSARGIIRPSAERSQLISPNTGYVIHSQLTYNRSVAAGDTLLVIDNSRILEEIKEAESKLQITEQNISDLQYLIVHKNPDSQNLKIPANRSSFFRFQQQLRQIDTRIIAQNRILDRQESLYRQKITTDSEIERYRLGLENLKEERSLIIQDQKFNWDTEIKSEQLNILSLKSRLKTLQRKKNDFILTAPRSGVLFNTKETPVGTLVNSGTVLSDLSPDDNLIVEVLILPSKIGLLHEENPVKYQIDAFNYRNWGLASGSIIEVSKEVEIINNQPVFKALATLEQPYLKLKNGRIGNLKRGLTLSARFKITERTLFDLLYDKIDDWLNPGRQLNSSGNTKLQ